MAYGLDQMRYNRTLLASIVMSLILYGLLSDWSTVFPNQPLPPNAGLAMLKQFLLPLIGIQSLLFFGQLFVDFWNERSVSQKVVVFVPLPDGASREVLPLLLEPEDFQIYSWLKLHGHMKNVNGGLKLKYKGHPIFSRSNNGERGIFRINDKRYTPVAIKVLRPKK
jgi:hypothetical protein